MTDRTGCIVLLLAGLLVPACGSDDDDDVGADADADADADTDADTDADADADGPPETVAEEDHPQVLASTWCEMLFECDCAELYADVESCEEGVSGQIAHAAEYYRSLGLTYDDRCPAAVLRQIEARACTGLSHPVEVGCAFCPFYYGDLARDEACTPVAPSSASTCAHGLFCLRAGDGEELTCADPCLLFGRYVGEGESCDPAAGVSCDPLEATCGASGTCEAFPVLGEPCPLAMCSGDSYCEPDTNVCVEYRRRGDTCADGIECETGYCDEGTCVSFCWPQPF